ncbi:hypothetical protein PsorP6_006595 [Peronosclerospora sorghi]|uniref:Uncharacterized protein n=1 Tax=Peronosclerospora sorghi TaxID=230839 RepID=A0ACC0W4S5_9STRA|nr:hypothetical protein PsorP6_006595 [Peronosclerospora sorghi]
MRLQEAHGDRETPPSKHRRFIKVDTQVSRLYLQGSQLIGKNSECATIVTNSDPPQSCIKYSI